MALNWGSTKQPAPKLNFSAPAAPQFSPTLSYDLNKPNLTSSITKNYTAAAPAKQAESGFKNPWKGLNFNIDYALQPIADVAAAPISYGFDKLIGSSMRAIFGKERVAPDVYSSFGDAMKQGLSMAYKTISKPETADLHSHDIAQLYFQGKPKDAPKITPLDVGVLGAIALNHIVAQGAFGEIAGRTAAGEGSIINSFKAARQALEYKQVGKITKPVDGKFGAGAKPITINLNDDLRVVVSPKGNKVIMKGYVRRFSNPGEIQTVLPQLEIGMRSQTGFPFTATQQGDDIILSSDIPATVKRAAAYDVDNPRVSDLARVLTGRVLANQQGFIKVPGSVPEETMAFDELPDYAKGALVAEARAQGATSVEDIGYMNSSYAEVDVPIAVLKESSPDTFADTFTKRGSMTQGPIVVDDSGQIIDGNNRAREAADRGETTIKAYVEVPASAPVEGIKIRPSETPTTPVDVPPDMESFVVESEPAPEPTGTLADVGMNQDIEYITRAEKTLLKERFRNQAKGGREAARTWRKAAGRLEKVAIRQTKRMMKQVRTRELADIATAQKRVIQMVSNNLPPEIRGRYLKTLARDLTSNKILEGVSERVVFDIEKQRRKADVKVLEQAQKKIANSSVIHVNYKKRVLDLLKGLDFKKMSDNTRDSLTKLSEVLQRDGEEFSIQDSARLAQRVARLAKKPLSELTNTDVHNLRSVVEQLITHGRLMKQLADNAIDRVIDAEVSQAIADTVNQDQPANVESNTARGMVGNLLRAQNVLMPTPQVANKFDGYKQFQGWNSQKIKSLTKQSNNATDKMIQVKIDTFEKLTQEAGLTQLPSAEDQIKMRIVMLAREKQGTAVDTLMQHYGIKEMPTLTPQQEKIIDIIMGSQSRVSAPAIAVYETLENKPFDKKDVYYLKLRYERQESDGTPTYHNTTTNPEPTVFNRATSKVAQGFTKLRKQNVTLLPRTDIFNMILEDIDEKVWYSEMQPLLRQTATITRDPRFKQHSGEVVSSWWEREIDIVSRRGNSYSAFNIQLLKDARNNLTTSVLMLRLSTIILQPFAVFLQAAMAQAMWGTRAMADVLAETIKTWVNPKYARKLIGQSQAVKLRGDAGEQALESIVAPMVKLSESDPKLKGFAKQTGIQKTREVAAKLIEFGDIRSAAASREAYVKILKRHGSTNAEDEADYLMEIANGSNNIVIRPQAYAYGELSRIWLMFQNFSMSSYALITQTIIKEGLIKGSAKKKLNALIALMIIIMGRMAEQMTRDLINRNEKPDSYLAQAVLTMPELLPAIGPAIATTYNGAGEPVILKMVKQAASGFKGAITAKKPETKIKNAIKSAEGLLSIFTSIPGSTQALDILAKTINTSGSSSKPKSGIKVRSQKVEPIKIKPIKVKAQQIKPIKIRP